ncbi:MAG: hypothetical protein RJA10_1422, partial [Pseudomonadota bacterium]
AVPAQPRGLLVAAQRLSADRLTALHWAVACVQPVLQPCTGARLLLKGAAYVAQGLPIAHGRLPSDLDLMVPQADIAAAQQALRQAGWQEAPLDEHDRRYYHEWSHEVPPMTHPLHRLELDLHHNILPPVARTRVPAAALLAHRVPVDGDGWQGWQVLAPVDQVLHCASHLFLDSEARARVRDLVDLDGLLRHFAAQPSFWPDLLQRADELGLHEPLALAIHFCAHWLQTPVPGDALERVSRLGPGGLTRALIRRLWQASLLPAEPDGAVPLAQDLSASLLLARYHRNRMPLRLLLPHVLHKWRKPQQPRATFGGTPTDGP